MMADMVVMGDSSPVSTDGFPRQSHQPDILSVQALEVASVPFYHLGLDFTFSRQIWFISENIRECKRFVGYSIRVSKHRIL